MFWQLALIIISVTHAFLTRRGRSMRLIQGKLLQNMNPLRSECNDAEDIGHVGRDH